MPWGIAAFLVMLFLVPFDAVELPVPLPVDPKLDRFLLLALAGLWFLTLIADGRDSPRLRSSPLNWGIFAFAAVAGLSIALRTKILNQDEELGLALKKLFLFCAFVLFFYIVSSSLRPRDLRGFTTLIVVLACVTALGTTYEFRKGTNYFWYLTTAAAPGGVGIDPEPPDPKYGRSNVTGPTGHGLSVTLLMAMALPFALVGLLEARRPRSRYFYAAAATLIFIGCFATVRKTGVITPAVSVLVMCAYRPREMLRLAPFGLVIVVVSQLVSPGALTGLRYQFEGGAKDSSAGRTDDYSAVSPDIKTHLILGRGFGSYDPKIHLLKRVDKRPHRTLDNQYLVLLVETGVVGVAAFAAMLLAAWGAAHRRALSPVLSRAGPAVAATAGIAAFAVASSLFDVLAFPHAVYMLFLLCGLAVAGGRPSSAGAGV